MLRILRLSDDVFAFLEVFYHIVFLDVKQMEALAESS